MEVTGNTALFPFLCGLCLRKFDRINDYYYHLKEHLDNIDNYFHACDVSADIREPGEATNAMFSCGRCTFTCPSICLLHEHLVYDEKVARYTIDVEEQLATELTDATDCADSDVPNKCDSKTEFNNEAEQDNILSIATNMEGGGFDNIHIQVKSTHPEIGLTYHGRSSTNSNKQTCVKKRKKSKNIGNVEKNVSNRQVATMKDQIKQDEMRKQINGKDTCLLCEICGLGFRRTKITMHVISHSACREFPCVQCPYRAKSMVALNQHVRKVHASEYNYTCDICGKTFKNVLYLKQHTDSHSVRDKQCTKCLSMFTTMALLRRHQLVHQDIREPGEAPNAMFSCGRCTFTCPSICLLHEHLVHDEKVARYTIDVEEQLATELTDATDCADSDVPNKCDSKTEFNNEAEQDNILSIATNIEGGGFDNIHIQVKSTHPEIGLTYHGHSSTNSNKQTCVKKRKKSENIGNVEKNVSNRQVATMKDQIKQDEMRKQINGKDTCLLCEICGLGFRRTKITMHVISHSACREFPCVQCPYRAKSMVALNQHVRKVHASEYNYTCDICGKTFKNVLYLKQHTDSHSVRDKQCTKCLSMFTTMALLRRHQLVHQDIREPGEATNAMFSCGRCTFTCPSICLLHEHLVHDEKVARYTIDVEEQLATELTDATDCADSDVPNKCDSKTEFNNEAEQDNILSIATNMEGGGFDNIHIQVKSTHPEIGLTYHGHSSTNSNKQTCVKKRKKSENIGNVEKNVSNRQVATMKDQIKQDEMRKQINGKDTCLLCEICGLGFRRTKITMHVISHSACREFPCVQCPYRAKSMVALNQHVRKVHASEYNYTCDICGKTFKNVLYLKQHTDSHSVRDKQCTKCLSMFTTMALLRRHQLVHQEIKEHKCGQCDKEFRFKGNLNSHVRTVHSVSRTFTCDICGQAFKIRHGLNKHRKIHEPKQFCCATCCKTFVTAFNLKVHMKVHKGDEGTLEM